MADIAVTATKVATSNPAQSLIRTYIATETITAGAAVYLTTAGKVGLADANAAGKQQCCGIALSGGGAGQAIDVIHRGPVSGFTLSGVAYWGIVYLSDTNSGILADAAGTMTVAVGRVLPESDTDLTKVLYVNCLPLTNWS